MTSNSPLWARFAARFTVGFAADSVAILALTPSAEAQTTGQNKAAVKATFNAWKAGTGNPLEPLADEASWTIEGNSVASKRYPTKEDYPARSPQAPIPQSGSPLSQMLPVATHFGRSTGHFPFPGAARPVCGLGVSLDKI